MSIKFETLLRHLENGRLGGRLAALSVQTKIEKFILAEIVLAGMPQQGLIFRLEERPRRDLTIRGSKDGNLLDWVEAKMCYSDCVARNITRIGTVDEYSKLVARDAEKQRQQLSTQKLPDKDRKARLTTALFVLHQYCSHGKHPYYPGFRNRGALKPSEIREEARRYCVKEVADRSRRIVTEDFSIQLDSETEMLCFFYRDSVPV